VSLPRLENDAYYTEGGVIDALFKTYPALASHEKYFDPCAGNCKMIFRAQDILKDSGISSVKILAADLYLKEEQQGQLWPHFDATKQWDWDKLRDYPPDVTITNPPFKGAIDILENALLYTKYKVAFLLRLSFLEPCRDRSFFLKAYADNLVSVVPLSPRPKFRSDSKGSDSVTVAWLIWDKQFSWKKAKIACPFVFVDDWK